MGKKRSVLDFLKSRAQDNMYFGDPEIDGVSYHQSLMHEVAKEFLEIHKDRLTQNEDDKDLLGEWCDEVCRRWQQGKFYKLWQEISSKGQDPLKAFEEKGWEA